ncbi:MAG: DUF1178 family protein, partial [Burkholderiaceae bacterium]
MKVLDLQCGQQHVFEGWFGSEDDFQSQLARGMVACPMCGDAAVTKKLSAPRLNLNTSRGEPETSASAQANPQPSLTGGAATSTSAPETAPEPASV